MTELGQITICTKPFSVYSKTVALINIDPSRNVQTLVETAGTFHTRQACTLSIF